MIKCTSGLLHIVQITKLLDGGCEIRLVIHLMYKYIQNPKPLLNQYRHEYIYTYLNHIGHQVWQHFEHLNLLSIFLQYRQQQIKQQHECQLEAGLP